MGEIASQKNVDVGLAQLARVRDSLLQKEAIELATFGEQFTPMW